MLISFRGGKKVLFKGETLTESFQGKVNDQWEGTPGIGKIPGEKTPLKDEKERGPVGAGGQCLKLGGED